MVIVKGKISEFSWMDGGKSRRTSVRAVGVPTPDSDVSFSAYPSAADSSVGLTCSVWFHFVVLITVMTCLSC